MHAHTPTPMCTALHTGARTGALNTRTHMRAHMCAAQASLATKTLIAELAVSILFSFHVSQLTQSTAVEQTAQICMELARLPDLMKE